MTYTACGIRLDSAVSFPELQKTDRLDIDCRFQLLPEEDRCPDPTSWIDERELADGPPWLSVAKTGSGYLVRFPSFADFLVSRDGHEISCIARPGTPLETIRHLLLDQLLPLVLSAFGRLVLHAGAVEVKGEALLFLGPSGAGKSTLVGALCQRGARVLADDCVVVDMKDGHPWAVPSYAGLRLWPSSVSALYQEGTATQDVAHYTEKRRVAPANERVSHPSQAVPIAGMYWLDPTDPIAPSPHLTYCSTRVVPLDGHAAYMALFKSTFQLDVTDQSATCRSFEQIGHLASTCSISRLQYARDFNHLDSVVETVLADRRT